MVHTYQQVKEEYCLRKNTGGRNVGEGHRGEEVAGAPRKPHLERIIIVCHYHQMPIYTCYNMAIYIAASRIKE